MTRRSPARKTHKLVHYENLGNHSAMRVYCQPHSITLADVALLPTAHDDWKKVTCGQCMIRRKKELRK